MMKFKVLIGYMIIALVFFSCDKNEGCTDEEALNFDITAEKDDNSCKYCIASSEIIGDIDIYLTDNNFGSQYYQQEIARVNIKHFKKSSNDESCGPSGCFFEARVYNLTDHTISNLDFSANISLPTGQSYQFNSGFGLLNIPVNSDVSLHHNNIDFNCVSIENGNVNSHIFSVSYL